MMVATAVRAVQSEISETSEREEILLIWMERDGTEEGPFDLDSSIVTISRAKMNSRHCV